MGDTIGSTAALELPDNVRALLENEAESGISSLKDKGYFVRVARRSATKREPDNLVATIRAVLGLEK